MAAGIRKEQLAKTRESLLNAAVTSLVTYGYAGTTTQRVQDIAGVSRGALLHHFGSKSELFVASIHHIASQRIVAVRQAADVPPGPDALRQVIYAIRESMTGPAFQAGMELWMAARTDPELRKSLLPEERALGAALREVFNKFIDDHEIDESRISLDSLLAILRGLELTRVMRTDEEAADAVIEHWIAHVAPILAPAAVSSA